MAYDNQFRAAPDPTFREPGAAPPPPPRTGLDVAPLEPVRATQYAYLQSVPVSRKRGAGLWRWVAGTLLVSLTLLLRALRWEPGDALLDVELAWVIALPAAAGLVWIFFKRDFGARRFMRAFNGAAFVGLLVAFALAGPTCVNVAYDALGVGFRKAASERFGAALSGSIRETQRRYTDVR